MAEALTFATARPMPAEAPQAGSAGLAGTQAASTPALGAQLPGVQAASVQVAHAQALGTQVVETQMVSAQLADAQVTDAPIASTQAAGAQTAGASIELPGAPSTPQATRVLPPPTSSQVVGTAPTPVTVDVVELLDQPVRTTFTFPSSSPRVTCTAPPGMPDITAVFGSVAFLTGFACTGDGLVRLTVRVAFTVLGTDANVRICQTDQVLEGSVGPGVDCTLALSPAVSVANVAQAGPRTVEATLNVGEFQVAMGQRRSVRLVLAPAL